MYALRAWFHMCTYIRILMTQRVCRRPRRTAFDADEDDDIPYWDVFIVDEGHKIKNPATQIYKALSGIPAHMRVLISGTPIQVCILRILFVAKLCVDTSCS